MTTYLHQLMSVHTIGGPRESGKGTADMGGVFKIDNCISVFKACFEKLMKLCHKKNMNTSNSILGYLVDSKALEAEREGCRCKATSTAQSQAAPLSSGLPPVEPKASMSKPSKSSKRKAKRSAVDDLFLKDGEKRTKARFGPDRTQRATSLQPDMETKREADELQASYGIKML